MSKEGATFRNFGRTTLRSSQFEANENEFETSSNPIYYPPPRTPLNSIPDPSQYEKESRESEVDSLHKSEAIRAGRYSDRKFEASSERFGNFGLNYGTPSVLARSGKSRSEPNSVQSTPARNGPRVSLGGAAGTCAGSRVPQLSGGRRGSLSTYLKGMSVANSDLCMEVPHFELKEDPSFWTDHNVQVLIRIRPLSTAEKLSQGYERCLRQESAQSLVWLGHPENRFTFDHIACETLSQENLFRVAGVPMVENCLSGYNSCMFAYGQTGSGKTYTMMGEIKQIEGLLTGESGMTPRVFDYLFKRIKSEEEGRWDDKLKYSCKCSFLEIYNEQITDLLEPSSTNLLLREDLKKGLYVENLTEHGVETVNDVLRLLLQGTANRKVAATYMNGESSRSHSVFTCIIESRWEKDSMTHFRFARLNLVDLAGSERQKSSGADSERLKEAANINKSLSTLGLVIMTLVDLAHGKPRHVPYRDSRLTFLLQDSLGGNSKTMIIANVSPSICSSNETLSTLKFAQRAKLIQNNAKVNEDASGDISALQCQIQQLKGQLSFLMKHKTFSSPSSSLEPNSDHSRLNEASEVYDSIEELILEGLNPRLQNREIKCMKATLAGALRREKMANTTIQNLQAEIERMNCLAQQREADAQHTAVKMRLYEEKIRQLELLVDGTLSAEKYLMDENRALREENKLLQARIDKDPELIRLALENDRLSQQLQSCLNFYEHGERERLLAENSELRDQLHVSLQEKLTFSIKGENQDSEIIQELKECRNMNSSLIREVERIHMEIGRCLNCSQVKSGSVMSSFVHPDELQKTDKYSLVETISMKSKSGDELPSYNCVADDTLENTTEGNALDASALLTRNEDENKKVLEAKLEKMSKDLEEVKLLNDQYQEKWAFQLSQKHQIESVCEEVEMETSRTILQLQEEVASLQLELEGRLCSITQENADLRNTVATKEEEIRTLCMEWERAILELTSFLLDGSRSLKDACGQVESISCSFPQVNAWISEHIELAVKSYIEKEETIQQLQTSLEDAQKMVSGMELKISSLREATIALSAVQQQDNDVGTEEAIQLRMLLNEKTNMVRELESEIKYKNNQVIKADKRADASFQVVKWLCDNHKVSHATNVGVNTSIFEQDLQTKLGSHIIPENAGIVSHLTVNDLMAQVELTKLEVLVMENAFDAICKDTEMLSAAFQSAYFSLSTGYRDLIQGTVKEIQALRTELKDLNMYGKSSECHTVCSPTTKTYKFLKYGDQHHTLCQIQKELANLNRKLNVIENCIITNNNVSSCPEIDEDLVDADSLSTDSSSVSDLSTESESVASGNKSDGSLCTCSFKIPVQITEHTRDQKFEGGSVTQAVDQESENTEQLTKRSLEKETSRFCVKAALEATFNAFNELFVHFSAILKDVNNGTCSYQKAGLRMVAPSFGMKRQKAEVDCQNGIEVLGYCETESTDSFLRKFEKAHATVKEADFMLNALTKAHEEAKQSIVKWKQTRENLMIDRAGLAEEIQQLKSSMYHKEEEIQLLKDHIHFSLTDMENSVSFLEEIFFQVQSEVEKSFKAIYSDAFSMAQEMLYFMNSLRSSVDDISSQIIEGGSASTVMCHCHLTELVSKFPCFNVTHGFHSARQEELKNLPTFCSDGGKSSGVSSYKGKEKRDQNVIVQTLQEEQDLSRVKVIYENLSLKKELERKEQLLEGLHFDFRLLQESAANCKDIKDETEKLIFSLGQARYELEIKTSQLEDVLMEKRKLEASLVDTEKALSTSNYELRLAKEAIDKVSDENAELRELLKEFYEKESEAEEKLEEQREVIKGLEEEILNLTASLEKKSISLLESIEDELRKVITERDQLNEEICVLNDKLEMAYSLADEKEALAVEARQESEASKLYAEQKEEEVKILEHSVDELECTINVLEKKVCEMDLEVGRYRSIRDSLEMELEALKERLLIVDNLSQNVDSDRTGVQSEGRTSGLEIQLPSIIMELHEALDRIKLLEEEKEEQDKEIKKCKEYVSEVVLHAEAQASQYQQKYKALESMFREVKTDISNSTTLEKIEKSSMRTRGSSSPFRCITNLVQQMNVEKDQELSVARQRVEELEALTVSRQKEICTLQTRLAAAENMTHDVIRDLLVVKLDMTNYANLIDQNQVLKLVEEAHHHREEFLAKEREILCLQMQINELIEERESCISELKTRESDILAIQIAMQQLQERDQLLSAQNEMLKMDKTNLIKKVAELDETVKTLAKQYTQQRLPQISKIKDRGSLKVDSLESTRKLSRRLSLANDELAQYYKSAGTGSKSPGETSSSAHRNRT